MLATSSRNRPRGVEAAAGHGVGDVPGGFDELVGERAHGGDHRHPDEDDVGGAVGQAAGPGPALSR